MDKKFLNTLDKSLNNLESEFKKTMEPASQVSNIIRDLENALSEKGIKYPFDSVVKKEGDESVIFQWRKSQISNKYKLHYMRTHGDQVINVQPFIEATLHERLQYYQYIPKFIDDFTLFLKKLREGWKE